MRTTTVGIDIGTATTTTVVARRERGGAFRIAAVGSAPSVGVRRGMVVDPEDAAMALKRSVQEASRAAGGAIRSAIVAVNGVHVGSAVVRGAIAVSRADGEITDDDVRRVMHAAEGLIPKNPNREVIHLIPRAYNVDGEGGVTDPVGMFGMKLEVEALVIDGAKAALANLIKCCELAGIEVEDWACGSLAAAEVLLGRQQRELGVMLLDLGAGTSDFAVFEEGRLVDAGSFPIGGSRITADIAIGLQTQFAAAEAIKLRHARAVADVRPGRRETIELALFTGGAVADTVQLRELADIVSARLADIFELASKALKRTGRSGLLPGGIVLTGGAADIPGILELARRELKLPVEVAKAMAVEAFTDVVPPRLAVSAGLVLWAAEQSAAGGGRAASRWGSGFKVAVKRFLGALVP